MIVSAFGKSSSNCQDVADVGAPEGVDRLVGVADHHQLGRLCDVLVAAGVERVAGHPAAVDPDQVAVGRTPSGAVAAQLADQHVLRVVGVLVLVDQDVPEPAAVGLAHLGEGLEQLHRQS